MAREMPAINHAEQMCHTCVTTKQRRHPFPWQALYREQEQLKLVYGDLCGPMMPVTPGGWRYCL